jgi:hypothetical protein
MQRNGIGQRQRQRLGQLPCPRRLRGIAPLSRGLNTGQLVGGLAAVADNSRRLLRACYGLAQPAAGRHRPAAGQRQGSLDEQKVGRHARARLGGGIIGLVELPELGVCLGQREVACRPQTRCDGVSLHAGERFVHQPGRLRDRTSNQVGVAQQQGQVRVAQTRYVTGRVGQLLCRTDEFVDAPGSRQARP